MQYNTYAPSKNLAAYIKYYWTLEDDNPLPSAKERIFPDGCVELLFHYGDVFKKYVSELDVNIQPRSFLHGQIKHFMDVEPTGKIGVFSIRFMPNGLPRFVKMSVDDLTDNIVEIQDLWGNDGRILQERIMQAMTAQSRIKVTEDFLLSRMVETNTRINEIDHCVHAILFGRPKSIDDLAEQVNLSRRQLERKFIEAVGLNPKTLTRITRFQRVLKHLEQNTNASLTEVAHANGYFDQSHFIKDFKEFTGFNPRQYFSNHLEFAKYLST